MIYIIFSILIGSITSLFLVSPRIYYPFLLVLILIGGVLVFTSKLSFRKPSKLILISLPIFILCSYFLTSIIIFKPKNINIVDIDNTSLSSSKKAVILYCDGEMEKYNPYYAGISLKNKPYIIKPIESYKIKKAYSNINSSDKNIDVSKIARDFRESLLKNSPNYFYLSYSGYTPNINESINLALKDGCQDITILNFCNVKTNEDLESIKNSLKTYGVKLKISTPIFKNIPNNFILKSIPNDLSKFNKIIILSNNSKFFDLKSDISKLGVDEANIILSNNISSEVKNLGDDINKVLVINLLDFSNGLLERYTIPKAFKGNISYQIISPFKYDKDFLEILVNEYKLTKNLSWFIH